MHFCDTRSPDLRDHPNASAMGHLGSLVNIKVDVNFSNNQFPISISINFLRSFLIFHSPADHETSCNENGPRIGRRMLKGRVTGTHNLLQLGKPHFLVRQSIPTVDSVTNQVSFSLVFVFVRKKRSLQFPKPCRIDTFEIRILFRMPFAWILICH
jgi:hypothetical protein